MIEYKRLLYLFLFLTYAATVLGLIIQGKIIGSGLHSSLSIIDFLSIILLFTHLLINIKQKKRSYWMLIINTFVFLCALIIFFQIKWSIFENTELMELLLWASYFCLAPYARVFILIAQNFGINRSLLLWISLLVAAVLLTKQIVLIIKKKS